MHFKFQILIHLLINFTFDPKKVTRALSQFLVTEDFRIVANDLDDLPEVNKEEGLLANCTWGKLEDRDPLFQSPEERAILPALPAPFTEKADIWKIANMTQFIMYKVINKVRKKSLI
jgi:glycoprotein-mannosyl O6-kinase